MAKYKFTEKVPFYTLQKVDENNIIELVQMQAVFPFGVTMQPVTSETLNDKINPSQTFADYLLEKDEYKELIIKINENKK